jgi:hypothetical protein
MVKCEDLIYLYKKRFKPGFGVGLNHDEDVYEFWLFAEILEALIEAKLLNAEKISSLKSNQFRETSFELIVAYYFLQKGHKVQFITSTSSPDLLVDDTFTVECKTTNPEKLKKTFELWSQKFSSRVGKIVGSKYLKVLLKKFMQERDWVFFEDEIKKTLQAKDYKYTSGYFDFEIGNANNYNSEIDLKFSALMR